jgi:hypothetical protein
MKDKEKVKPIYYELQGYLSQAPSAGKGIIFTQEIWLQHNQTIDELEKVTSSDYGRYRMRPKNTDWNGTWREVIDAQVYRTILGGLIARLHGEYFPDEKLPELK